MFSKWLALALLFPASQTMAKSETAIVREQLEELQKIVGKVNKKSLIDMCREAADAAPSAPDALKTCYNTYAPLVDKKVIKIDYVAGYLNFDDVTTDGAERAGIAGWLQKPCAAAGVMACGFSRDPKDADLLFKTVPWIDGKEKRIEVRLTNPSVTSSDKKNSESPLQKIKSQRARERYQKALATSDIVFYSGHSRGGIGPDFEPLAFTNLVGQVFREGGLEHGVRLMKRALAQRKDKMFLMGLLSCESEKYFGETLKESGKVNSALLSVADSDDDDRYGLVEVIENVLGLRCPIFKGAPKENVFRLRKL